MTANVNILRIREVSGRRIFIEDVYPSIDAGHFPVKRIVGEPVHVWADIFRDGHAVLAAELLWRPATAGTWSGVAMLHYGNDRWTASFTPVHAGRYVYAIEAWTDEFATWRRDFLLKREAGLDVTLEAEEGRLLLAELKTADRKPFVRKGGLGDVALVRVRGSQMPTRGSDPKQCVSPHGGTDVGAGWRLV